MRCLLDRCSSLSSLPVISKWNTNNVTNMNDLFFGCSSLKSLPDISKWNTNNVINMNYTNSIQSIMIFFPIFFKITWINFSHINDFPKIKWLNLLFWAFIYFMDVLH